MSEQRVSDERLAEVIHHQESPLCAVMCVCGVDYDQVALDLRDARAEAVRLRESEAQARGQFAHDQVTIARLREAVTALREALVEQTADPRSRAARRRNTVLAATAWVEEKG